MLFDYFGAFLRKNRNIPEMGGMHQMVILKVIRIAAGVLDDMRNAPLRGALLAGKI
jgi:hypothetical protein